jgi:hypothetical protein
MLLKEQFLSQTSEAFVSGIVEVEDGVFHFVICGDKVKHYAKPFSVPISMNGAAVCRVFILLHQYWRRWHMDHNLEFPCLPGATKDESSLFSPMFLMRSEKSDNKMPLKHVSYSDSFALLQQFMTGQRKIESLVDVVERKAAEIMAESDSIALQDKSDQKFPAGDEECFLEDAEDGVELFDGNEKKSEAGSGMAAEVDKCFDGSGRAIVEQLYKKHFAPDLKPQAGTSGSMEAAAVTNVATNEQDQGLSEFFRFVPNHRHLRVTYVQYKSYIFSDNPDMLDQLSHLQRHGSAVEETVYAPYRAELFSRKAKEFLCQQFGQTSFHSPPDPLMESVAQHLVRMREVQPRPSPQAWEAIRKIGMSTATPYSPSVEIRTMANQNMKLVEMLLPNELCSHAPSSAQLAETTICLSRPTFVLGSLPVFLLSQTVSIKCSECRSTCLWHDMSADRIKEEVQWISTKSELSSDVLLKHLLGSNFSHIVVCPFRKESPKCVMELAFLTSDNMSFTIGGGRQLPPETLIRDFMLTLTDSFK